MYLQRNNKLVWDETVKIMQGLFNLWGNQDAISVNHVVDITLPVGCLIDHLVFSYPGLCRLHFSLLELQACTYNHYFIFPCTDAFLGFGRSVSWEEDVTIPPGHTMTYKDALHIATTDFLLKLLVPGWALSLTPRLRRVKLGFEELHVRR